MQVPAVNPTIVPLAQSAGAALRAGQQLNTVVQGRPGALFLQLAGKQIPLPENTPLPAGALVQVHVLESKQGLQLQVAPRPGSTAPAVPQLGAAPLQQVLARVLEALGAKRDAPTLGILPQQLPADAGAVRLLLHLFMARGTLTADLQSLAATLQQAAAAGALAPESAAAFQSLLASFSAAEAPEWERLLRRLSDSRPMAARLASILEGGDPEKLLDGLHAQLRAEISRLRGNDALRAFLQGNRQLRQFEETLQRVFERLSGSDLQNLRGLDQAYVFIEVPLPPGGEFSHLQVHFFGEGRRRHAKSAKEGMVVLDLATTRLGDLWITLRSSHGQCQCAFRAKDPAALAALEAGRQELEGSLRDIGFTLVDIRIDSWNGDRLEAAATLMRQFTGFTSHA